LTAATNAAPKLEPDEVVGVASTASSAQEAAVRAQYVAAYTAGSKMNDLLVKQGVDWQAKFWKTAPNSIKAMLSAAGYTPPSAQDVSQPSGGGGWFHDAIHYADDVRHAGSTVAHYTVRDPFDAMGKVFTVAGAPVTHAMRAAFKAADSADTAAAQQGHSFDLSTTLHALDPTRLLNDWSSTKNGATSYQPDVLMYVKKIMGVDGETLKLAQIFAGGSGLQSALSSVPPNERANAYALIESNPKFMDAVKLLADSHLSAGQVIFGGLNASQHAQLFPKASAAAMEAFGLVGQAAGVGGAVGALAEGNPEGITGALSDASEGVMSLRTATALGVGGVMALGSAKGDIEGETPDVATQMSPFGIKINPLSGITDALTSWFSNPLFNVMQARQAYSAAEHSLATLDSMGNARDVRAYYNTNSSGIRWAQKFATLVTSPDGSGIDRPNFNALQTAGIKVDGMEHDITEAYPAIKAALAEGNPERAVGEFVAKEQTLIGLFRGRAGLFYHDATQFPHMTLSQSVLEDIKGVGSKVMQGRRFAADSLSPRQLATDAFGDAATRDGMAAADEDNKLSVAARFMRRATNLVPTEPFFKLSDDKIASQIQRFARFSLPEDKVAQAVNGFMAIAPEDIGAKRTFLLSLIQDVLNDAGVAGTAKGREWMATYFEREQYSVDEDGKYANPRNPDGPKLAHAVFDTQIADAVAMPNFRELYKFAKKSWFMSALDMSVNDEHMDWFMSKYWKRIILLRPGFALRVGGEEVLNYMLRNGPRSFAESRVAASLYDTANAGAEARAAAKALAEKASQGDIDAMNDQDSGQLYNAMTSSLPPEVMAAIRTPEELRAAVTGWNAIDVLRRMGLAFVPEQILQGAYELARRGVLDSAFSDYIDAITSHGGVYTGDLAHDSVGPLLRNEDGEPVYFVNSGEMTSVEAKAPEAPQAFAYKLGSVANSEIGRAVARAWGNGGTDAMLQEAKDQIEGRAIQQKMVDALHDGNDGLAEIWQKKLADRITLMKKFPQYFQTQDGRTVASGQATQLEANNDFAQLMVDTIKDLTMTTEGQDFDDEGERIPVEGQQPIRLPSTLAPKTPWKIATRDVDRNVNETDPEHPYESPRVPAGEIRLFRGENTTTAASTSGAMGGREWTANFQQAMNRAGADGQVYHINVPVADLDRHYDFHGAEGVSRDEYVREIQEAQTRFTSAPARGTFESGDVLHSREGDNSPNLLIDQVGRGIVPGVPELRRVDRVHYPDNLVVPQQILKIDPKNATRGILEHGMEQAVGRPLNWISRQPIFTRNYAVSLDETSAMLKARGIEDESGDLAHDIAMERAFNETLPYIHNPGAKSQFSVIVRNMMPFWFAQEQFFKRWGHLFGTYPEAWYKLSQTMNGLKSVGFVQPDVYGEEAFVYPGSQAVLSLLTKLPFFGSIPVGVSFTGEINQLNPTLTAGGPAPGFGPVITIPTSILAVMFKRFMPAAQAIQGSEAPPIDEDGNWIETVLGQLLPSLANRAIEYGVNASTASTSNVTQPIFMSAMIQAAQQMEATGHGITDAQASGPGGETLTNQYLDRLVNWTKNLILLRAAFGFLAPATPTFQIGNQNLGNQLTALMATMPYDEAVTAFLSQHPNATADTIFESTTSGEGESGTYVPATTQAVQWIGDNNNFVNTFSQLAPWAMPSKLSQGLFNSTAYDEESALGLRLKRPLSDPSGTDGWYQDVKYSEGANVYYPLESQFQAAGEGTSEEAAAAQAQLGMTQAQAQAAIGMAGASKSQLSQVWDKWKSGFLTTHPVFQAQYVLRGDVATARRNDVVQQLNQAISEGALPQSDWSSHIDVMMVAYNKVQSAYPSLEGTTAATQNKASFLAWGTAYAKAYPVVAPFWNGVLSLQVSG
jgi:hypothetical protein